MHQKCNFDSFKKDNFDSLPVVELRTQILFNLGPNISDEIHQYL